MTHSTKVICNISEKEIIESNIDKHIREHYITNTHDKLPLDRENLRCCFCGRVCKTSPGLGKHQVHCHNNPNRIEVHREKGTYKAWNKGLTKRTDVRLADAAIKRKQYYLSHRGSFYGKAHSTETKERLRKAAIENGLGGHCYKHIVDYNGIKWDSSYEVAVAKSLDENHIAYERPGRFKYVTPDGKQHTYTPDIYLPTFNVYLDPKSDFLINNNNPATGYKDLYKISLASNQNNIRVIVLDKNHLHWSSILSLIIELDK